MKWRRWIFWFVFGSAIFAVRYAWALPKFDANYAGTYRGRELTMEGQVTLPPEESSTQLQIDVERFKLLGSWYFLHGVVLVRVPIGGERFHYGDKIRVIGRLDEPFRADPRIAAVVGKAKIQLLENGEIVRTLGQHIIAGLADVKGFFIGRLNAVFPEPASSFAAGILFGSRSSLPKNIVNDFKQTGLTHILALSGYNIVILITFIESLLSFLNRRWRNIFALIFIFVFTLLVGAGASVVRAAIMGSLGLFARIFGRPSAGLRALFITGYIMILFDPFLLLYDIGFQLSFGATAGILLFTNPLKKRLAFLPNWLGMRDSFTTTTAAQAFTLPLIIFYFQGFSIVTPAANLVVLPFMPILMLGSFLALLIGKIPAAPTLLIFDAVLAVIHFFASLPFSFVSWA
ncbi:MAG: ComEC/Rec2 family competence protein [Patescibacteria group bacterium]